MKNKYAREKEDLDRDLQKIELKMAELTVKGAHRAVTLLPPRTLRVHLMQATCDSHLFVQRSACLVWLVENDGATLDRLGRLAAGFPNEQGRIGLLAR